MSEHLLLEIGLEELPAGFIDAALEQMRTKAEADLSRLRLSHDGIDTYGTPRRLAVLVRGVSKRQDDLVKEMKGPSKSVAFAEDGTPTRAAEGFARGQGVDVGALEVRDTEQGPYVYAVTREEGLSATDVLTGWLPGFVSGLQFPKSMRWGEGTLRFARPVRWLVALFGAKVLPFELGGVTAGRSSVGHRFLVPQAVELREADEYVERMRESRVLVDGEERRALVGRLVDDAAEAAGGRVVDDGSLVAEVAHLIEYPAAVVGAFDDEYLALPDDVLITPMREHQRYFPVANETGKLLPRFVAVSNGPRPDEDLVRRGYEKVLTARLDDARFFYDEDRKQSLRDKIKSLQDVVFQQRLGTLYDKTERIRHLAATLGAELRVDEEQLRAAREGARLAKADLVTLMVQEFPELQGVMGREYAKSSGEDAAVAEVIYEHYLPRYAGDRLPQTDAGRIVSIADKVDTIVGCFGVGLIPTGSQDPYALRRQALGVVRTILDAGLPLHMGTLFEHAYDGFSVNLDDREQTLAQVQEFFLQRVRGVLLEEGIRHDVADAVLAADGNRLASVAARAQALQRFSEHAEFDALLTAYERVANLAGHARDDRVDSSLFEEDAEAALYDAVKADADRLPGLLKDGRYEDALRLLAGLRPAVDTLFADVMVMAEDEAIRYNRLALLKETLALFDAVARFDLVVVANNT